MAPLILFPQQMHPNPVHLQRYKPHLYQQAQSKRRRHMLCRLSTRKVWNQRIRVSRLSDRYLWNRGGQNSESEACLSCATGRYNSSTGQTSCLLICPSGKYGNVTGASSVDEGCPNTCPLGRYGFNGKTTLKRPFPCMRT